MKVGSYKRPDLVKRLKEGLSTLAGPPLLTSTPPVYTYPNFDEMPGTFDESAGTFDEAHTS